MLEDLHRNAVVAAAERLHGHVRETPVLHFAELDALAGAELWLKAENMQFVGAFKARGAMNAALQLSDEERRRGDEAVNQYAHLALGGLQHGTRHHGDFETANLAQDAVWRLRCVRRQCGPGTRQHLTKDVAFGRQSCIVKTRSATDAVVQWNACHQMCNGGSGGGVANAHFAEPNDVGAGFGQAVHQICTGTQALINLMLQ